MTSFEQSGELPGESSLTATEIPIPDEADEDWCNMVASAYGNGKYRTIVEVDYMLRCRFDPHSWIKSYERVKCPPVNGEAGRLNGLLIGTKMIPDFYDGPYEPYLVLVDVEQEDTPYWIAQSPEQEFLVPLTQIDEIAIFPDQY